jgi:hypothetical protein
MPPAHTVAQERRCKPRLPVNRDVWLRLVDDPHGKPLPARLVDLSATGVGLRMNRPLAPGKEFSFELSGAKEGVGSIRYRVARCIPLGQGKFHVGSAFIRNPK